MAEIGRKLRAPMKSLVACTILLASSAAAAASDDANLSTQLKQQTELFAQASQTGNATVLARFLDADVVFTNEIGEVAGRQDLIDSAAPPPASAPQRQSEITDWTLHRQGADLATATFVDRVTTTIGGQILTLAFRSTETWARRSDGWKMIVSQTMNVPRPPAAITLPAAALNDYVGTYKLGNIYTVRISMDGKALVASVNNAPPVPLQVEVKDVLFTPGTPNARRIFQRNGSGQVVGYINRRDGADLSFRKIN